MTLWEWSTRRANRPEFQMGKWGKKKSCPRELVSGLKHLPGCLFSVCLKWLCTPFPCNYRVFTQSRKFLKPHTFIVSVNSAKSLAQFNIPCFLKFYFFFLLDLLLFLHSETWTDGTFWCISSFSILFLFSHSAILQVSTKKQYSVLCLLSPPWGDWMSLDTLTLAALGKGCSLMQ